MIIRDPWAWVGLRRGTPKIERPSPKEQPSAIRAGRTSAGQPMRAKEGR